MLVKVKMPKLGETAEQVAVLEWLVAEGETVAEGDTLMRVETDKVDADFPSPVAGVVTELLVAPDDEVEVGDAVCVIRT